MEASVAHSLWGAVKKVLGVQVHLLPPFPKCLVIVSIFIVIFISCVVEIRWLKLYTLSCLLESTFSKHQKSPAVVVMSFIL
jgi:hypothetical protein